MLSQKALNEFKQIYYEIHGEWITDMVADTKGKELLNYFKLIYRPILKD